MSKADCQRRYYYRHRDKERARMRAYNEKRKSFSSVVETTIPGWGFLCLKREGPSD